jgi:hypothetical protein
MKTQLPTFLKFSQKNQPIRLPGLNLRLGSGQTPRGMPFDNLKAPSTAEGLRVDTERRFLPRFQNRGLPSTRGQAEGAPSNVSIPQNWLNEASINLNYL